MIEKRRCPNCGAYVTATDKTCYVCGEVLPLDTANESPVQENTTDFESERRSAVIFEPEKDEDFVMPVDFDEASGIPPEDRLPYDEDEVVSAESESEKRHREREKKRSKKVAVICGVIIAVALIAAGVVCALHFSGILSGAPKPGEKITIYFDKPSASINLTNEKGEVFNWTADVNVLYTSGEKQEEIACKPCEDSETLWECKIPADASKVYFMQAAGAEIRTQLLPGIEHENVYYVIDTTFNIYDELMVDSCKLRDFDKLGINAPTEAATVTTAPVETTEPETEEESEAPETEPVTEEETEPEPDDDTPYTVSVPSSWENGTTEIVEGNCTSYYENYNLENSGLGRLLSIYVFDADDPEIENLNPKRTFTTSDGSKKILAVTPSDFQCDDTDEESIKKYTELEKFTNEVIDSISVN